MNRREREQLLEHSGFNLVRNTGKHAIYSNGVKKLIVPTGGGVSSRNENNLKADLKRLNRAAVWKPAGQPADIPQEQPKLITADKEPSMNHVQKTSGFPSYRPDYMEKLRKRVVELAAIGCSRQEMTTKLNEEGFRNTQNGKFSVEAIQNFRIKFGVAKRYSVRGAPPVKHKSRVEMATAAITPPKLAHAKRLPDTAIAILTDPDLSAPQKVDMLMAYAR